jgi:Flp pilus assembly protein TadD
MSEESKTRHDGTGGAYFLRKLKPFVFKVTLCFYALAVTLFIVQRGASQVTQSPAENQLLKGIQLLRAGQLPESVKAFNNAKQASPLDPRPYFYCGMALAQAGRMQDAAGELAEAVHLAPDQLQYRIFLAHVFEQLKQTHAAVKTLAVFQDEQTLRQLTAAWLRLLADDYYRLGMAEEALRVLNRWAELDPKDSRIALYRGQAYELEGRPDEALKFFEMSVSESDLNPLAFFEMGKILYARNQLPAAKQALLKAVREDKNNPDYLSHLALIDLAMNDPDAAIKCLRSVESEGDRFPALYYVLATAYRKKGDRARKAEYMTKFQQATAADQDRKAQTLAAERPIAQAERELDQGQTAEALALFEKAAKLNPNRWEPHAFLAEIFLNAGKLDLAYPHLLKMEQIDSYSAVGNFLLARYWFKRGDYERAMVYAEKVRAIRPDNSELHAFLGDVYMHLGDRQQALREYKAVSEFAPNRAGLKVLIEKGEPGEHK